MSNMSTKTTRKLLWKQQPQKMGRAPAAVSSDRSYAILPRKRDCVLVFNPLGCLKAETLGIFPTTTAAKAFADDHAVKFKRALRSMAKQPALHKTRKCA